MLAHVLARLPDRDGGRVRLRRPSQIERGLREVQLRLRQTDVLERMSGSDCDDQRLRVGVADVLGGEDHHPARDEPWVFPRLQHHGEVVHRRVRVAPRSDLMNAEA